MGGDGIRRDIQVLTDAQVTLLSDRREIEPYGLNGGQNGTPGENLILLGEGGQKIRGKCSFELHPGDILSIRTPGGGGYGSPQRSVSKES